MPQRAHRSLCQLERKLDEPLHTLRHQLRLGRLGLCMPRLLGLHRLRHGTEVEKHRGEVHAGDAVHHRVVRLRDQREAVVVQALHEPHLPEGLRAVEPLGEDAAGEEPQLVHGARCRERGVAHVVLDVEPRVVDPHRPAHLEPREGQLLPVARHEVQPRLHVSGQIVVGGRRALEQQDGAHVHVGSAPLLRQKRGIDRAQAVHVPSGHSRSLSGGPSPLKDDP